MSNPWKDYLQNFRDNLPIGVTYREDIARYIFNDKRFILPDDVVRYKNYLEKLGFGETFDPDAAAYITAVETTDGEPLEAGVKAAINDFVVGCKADAIWDAIKASCILAGARTLNGCLVPLVGTAPTNFNFVTADYNRKTGLKGDGSTKYLAANVSESAANLGNRSVSIFFGVPSTTASTGCVIGHGTGGGDDATSLFVETDGLISRNQNSSAFRPSGIPSISGLFGNTRSNTDNFSTLVNGVSTTVTRGASLSGQLGFGVFSRSGGDFPTAERLSFYHIGEAIDLAALDTRVSTFMEDLAFTLNTGLSPADYDRDTINYVNAGYAAGGSLE